MIEKNALYESLQSAFSTNHPKFPWPKRHDLVDQTPEFQEAFDQFANETNEMIRSEIISHKEIERDHYRDQITDLKIELKDARFWKTLYFLTIGAAIGAFIIGFMVGAITIV